MYEYIKIANSIVHTSIKPEPFGRVIIEGMAFKKTVIATKSGGVLDIIEHKNNGLLYEPGNSKELADCINLLYSNNELNKKLSINGHNSVVKKFNSQIYNKKIEKIYSTIYNSGNL